MSEYGDRLRAKSIGFLSKGVTKPQIVEGRDSDGARTKAVTDELGHTVVEHNNKKDQVDVHIKAPAIHMTSEEIRNG